MWRAFLNWLSGEDHFVSIDELYEAAKSDAFVQLERSPEEKGEWCLVNVGSRFLYRRTLRPDGRVAETLDGLMKEKKGGVIVTFVNDQLVALTHNARQRVPADLDSESRTRLWQILLLVRASV